MCVKSSEFYIKVEREREKERERERERKRECERESDFIKATEKSNVKGTCNIAWCAAADNYMEHEGLLSTR